MTAGAAAKATAKTPAKPPAKSPEDDEDRCSVLTVGHSTRPLEDFVALLKGHAVTQLVDVRTVPRSRHNPQFAGDALAVSLPKVGIAYAHAAGLGGFRRAAPDSINAAWRNASFRGYADYMQTADFDAELQGLIELAQQERVVLMCAEAVPWRCHRSLIADALLAHGITTCEIASPQRLQPHRMTPFAQVSDCCVTYPPEPADT